MKIWNPLKDKSKVQLTSYSLFLASVLLLTFTIYANFHVDVLKDWKLTMPEQKIHAGDKVVVQSVYNKIRAAGGESVRYLDCKTKDGVFLRYELNRKKADRKVGEGGTGIDIVMRDDIPDLPTTCKVSIAISYDTFIPWYKYLESTSTDEFTLHPKETISQGVSKETSRTQIPNSSNRNFSYSQNNPQAQTEQRNTSQESQVDTPSPEEPTIIQQLDRTVTNLVDGLVSTVRNVLN